ncbi:MAG: DUF11 domain-containing protein, partial [Chloroflexi bacterium]|nr:DUF11 domain-containing protein [Chloroflexota bacterium]
VVNYTIIITNTSSDDSPNLVKDSIVDSLLGSLSGCDSLATSDSCTINVAYTVKEGDPDPLVNTVTVHYHPSGFPNDITASASHSTDLVHPDFTLSKQCDPTTAGVGQTITYNCTIANTGDITLNRVSVTDSLLGDITSSFPASLTPGQSTTVSKSRTVLASDPNPLVNVVTATYQVAGLSNQLTRSSSCSTAITGCAHTMGYWKTHPEQWDQASDYTTAFGGTGNPGFVTTSVFPWLDPSLPASTTYLDILNMSVKGDITVSLAQQYISAKLNQAFFGVPANIAQAISDTEAYLAAHKVGSKPTGAARQAGADLQSILGNYNTNTGTAACPTQFK